MSRPVGDQRECVILSDSEESPRFDSTKHGEIPRLWPRDDTSSVPTYRQRDGVLPSMEGESVRENRSPRRTTPRGRSAKRCFATLSVTVPCGWHDSQSVTVFSTEDQGALRRRPEAAAPTFIGRQATGSAFREQRREAIVEGFSRSRRRRVSAVVTKKVPSRRGHLRFGLSGLR